ncbi:hypothetical protein PPACK8108_LOCUS12347 [Phakopsora pachyrhizi]|uniref:Uncharacterized protein n=1 Tax=Phakopsora pachyrhizi TaxID=170000 RepID=A0AAV0B4M9_PHAPC|nr:hypothetical protein PPACK8108_LOCUS12347 [Phakopsora pachyrhizi]
MTISIGQKSGETYSVFPNSGHSSDVVAQTYKPYRWMTGCEQQGVPRPAEGAGSNITIELWDIIVICKTFSEAFKRNSINNGLICIKSEELVKKLKEQQKRMTDESRGGKSVEVMDVILGREWWRAESLSSRSLRLFTWINILLEIFWKWVESMDRLEGKRQKDKADAKRKQSVTGEMTTRSAKCYLESYCKDPNREFVDLVPLEIEDSPSEVILRLPIMPYGDSFRRRYGDR